MKKPDMSLIPWDCLRVADKLSPNLLAQLMRLYWTRRTDKLPPVLPRELLIPVARVLTMGAEKYSVRGWETDTRYHTVSQHFAAFMRHAAAPEELDAESGLLNTWHMACRYIMLAALLARGVLVDDRPEKQPNSYERDELAIDVVVEEGAGEGGLWS